jgi:hypothetical protein
MPAAIAAVSVVRSFNERELRHIDAVLQTRKHENPRRHEKTF